MHGEKERQSEGENKIKISFGIYKTYTIEYA
jgi:hypothetical protein